MTIYVPVLYRSPDDIAEALEIQRSRLTSSPQSRIDAIIRRETEAGTYTAEELRGLTKDAIYLAALRLR